MVRLRASAIVWLIAPVLLAGCSGNGNEEKTAACTAWRGYEAALEKSNRTLGLPKAEQVAIFEAEFQAYGDAKKAFAVAAAADESWSDVQEAVYSLYTSDEAASRRKVVAACDRLSD